MSEVVTIEILKTLGDESLKIAKDELLEDGEVTAVIGYVNNVGEAGLIALAELPRGAKKEVYATVAMKLLREKAIAAVLVNDSYMKTFPKPEDADAGLANYKQGDYSVDQEARECIIVAFKGETFPSMVKCLPYTRGPLGDITFEPEMGWLNAEMNMLPDWWTFTFDPPPEDIRAYIQKLKESGYTAKQMEERLRSSQMGLTERQILAGLEIFERL